MAPPKTSALSILALLEKIHGIASYHIINSTIYKYYIWYLLSQRRAVGLKWAHVGYRLINGPFPALGVDATGENCDYNKNDCLK